MSDSSSLPIPDPPGVQPLRRALLDWYRQHRRPLPWRKTGDSYAILVSEFMLQQTRAATVVPYYRSFLRRFPTLRSLADAEDEDVRAAWSGLGYYSRARNLQAAAQCIAREHEGVLPADYEALRALPGVGDYTAAALASIVHGTARAVVDGNVIRVLSRLVALGESVSRTRTRRSLQDLAGRLLDPRHPGPWNQAVMELGAVLCTPRAPHCSHCPWRDACRGLAAGTPEEFPHKDPVKAPVTVERAVGVFARRGKVLLVRRRHPRLLDGTWEFPGLDLEPGASAPAALAEHLERVLHRPVRVGSELARIKHTITHRRITIRAFSVEAAPSLRSRRNERLWVNTGKVQGLPLSSMTTKLLRGLRQPESGFTPSGRPR